MKRAGRSMQHIKWAKCIQAIPVCPQPLAPMRGALANTFTARLKAFLSIMSAIRARASPSIMNASLALFHALAFILPPYAEYIPFHIESKGIKYENIKKILLTICFHYGKI
jgi:hypothetical protein